MPDKVEESGSENDHIYDKRTDIIYIPRRLLGKGGFARVYEIIHPHTGIPYADKIIRKEIFTRRRNTEEKVTREIELHKKLSGHPNVVGFIDCFEDAQSIHIVLEYCGMKSLLHLLRKQKYLAEENVKRYVSQICAGVQYIHRKGILHRDLKLGNMFLTLQDMVKIGDFGLATTMERNMNLPNVASDMSSVTLCGTPNYIAPEVLLKKGHCKQSDYWAIGCMTFAMLMGQPPFETDSLKETYERILKNKYTFPMCLSKEAKIFISKLLKPDPQDRGDFEESSTDCILHHHFLSPTYSQMPPFKKINKKYPYGFLDRIADKIEEGQVYRKDLNVTTINYVTKWIDYSNKFGFGYQLNDGSIGVIFNDGSRIRSEINGSKILLTTSYEGTVQTRRFHETNVPREYQAQWKLLLHFKQYMEENLADSIGVSHVDTSGTEVTSATEHKRSMDSSLIDVEVVHWCRTENCVVMVLSNTSVQVNFLREHYKLIYWESGGNRLHMMVLSNNLKKCEELKTVSYYCALVLRHVHNFMQ